jgi:sec-independent protein translocase protein TatB
MPLPVILCFCLSSLARVAGAPLPVRLASFGIPDTLFIVVIALIVFGPKKLPEISRQLGKLLYEFRKASNDFKFQIEEELRSAEQAERQKQLNAQASTPQPATPVTITAGETVSAESVPETLTTEGQAAETQTGDMLAIEEGQAAAEVSAESAETPATPTIAPPATGLPVSSRSPYRAIENAEGGTAVTAAGESLDEPQTLDELQANAQEALRAAEAEQYHQPEEVAPTNSVPTHHG